MTEKEKKLKILEAARGLFLHYGLKKTTIEDIARSAGVGKGTVYLYFQSKEEILNHIGFEQFRQSLKTLEGELSGEESWEKRLRILMKMKPKEVYLFVKEHPHAMELLPYITPEDLKKGGYDKNFNAYFELIHNTIKEGIEKGEAEDHGNMERLISYITFMSEAFMPRSYCVDTSSLEELMEMVDLFVDQFLCYLKR